MTLTEMIQKLNRNKIFKFTSSVKLAVPLMLVLGFCVAYGTVIESNYNSEYAKMSIYNTKWFLVLLGLLWVNIFNATISRIPFKKHHTGFVVTHIGLLTLLIGALITGFWGIDGQLRITEGQTGSQVVLPRQMLSYQIEGTPTPQSIVFDRTLNTREGSQLSFLNDSFGHLFTSLRLVPFAKIEKNYLSQSDSQDVALSFILKSQFFNVTEWLHSKDNPEMKMGPATLRLIVEDANNTTKAVAKKIIKKNKATKTPALPAKSNTLVIKDAATQAILKEIAIPSSQKEFVVNGVKVQVAKVFRRAVVAQNKLEENTDPNADNPALELNIESKGQKKREVCYAKFPGFSLNKDGDFGLRFEYVATGSTPIAESNSDSALTENSTKTVGASQVTTSRVGNTIEFHVVKGETTKARIELYKNNEFVGGQWLQAGETYQTPWMGARITLATLIMGSTPSIEASPATLSKGMSLPPSALLIRPEGGNEFWLSEGDVTRFQSKGRNITIYLGREVIELPFTLKLLKFTKMDYPGTETPMSYESDVEVKETGLQQKISMNEPLKHDGFTVYQASYSLNPGAPADSIFSVNRDPGRALKYIGSLILGIGIILFTLMKSRAWKKD